MRAQIFKVALAAGGNTHLGGGLSIVDIMATLYGEVLRFDTNRPEWTDRDRFILSKGHGSLGLYTALADVGFIPEVDLMRFEKSNSYLLGHPVMNRKHGIEFSTGSLGMGLSLGIGVALAAKRRGLGFKVYVLMGDGECNEGSVWEAALAAPQFRLDNIIGIVDRNNFQQTGANRDIMSMGDIGAKWRSFGWDVSEVNGHDVGELWDVFKKDAVADTPRLVVAHTIKGKGFALAENNNDWHHATLTQTHFQAAMEGLK